MERFEQLRDALHLQCAVTDDNFSFVDVGTIDQVFSEGREVNVRYANDFVTRVSYRFILLVNPSPPGP